MPNTKHEAMIPAKRVSRRMTPPEHPCQPAEPMAATEPAQGTSGTTEVLDSSNFPIIPYPLPSASTVEQTAASTQHMRKTAEIFIKRSHSVRPFQASSVDASRPSRVRMLSSSLSRYFNLYVTAPTEKSCRACS